MKEEDKKPIMVPLIGITWPLEGDPPKIDRSHLKNIYIDGQVQGKQPNEGQKPR